MLTLTRLWRGKLDPIHGGYVLAFGTVIVLIVALAATECAHLIFHIGGSTGFAYAAAGVYAASAVIGVRRSLRRTHIQAVFCEG